MSADIRISINDNWKFKGLSCHKCNKPITNYDNLVEGHEDCVDDDILRIDYDWENEQR